MTTRRYFLRSAALLPIADTMQVVTCKFWDGFSQVVWQVHPMRHGGRYTIGTHTAPPAFDAAALPQSAATAS